MALISILKLANCFLLFSLIVAFLENNMKPLILGISLQYKKPEFCWSLSMNIWKPRQIKSVTTNWWQLRSSTGSYDQLAGCQICSYDQQGLTVTTNFLKISRCKFSLPAELKHMVIAEIHSVIWHRHVSVIWAQRTVKFSWYPRLFGFTVFGRRHLGWW